MRSGDRLLDGSIVGDGCGLSRVAARGVFGRLLGEPGVRRLRSGSPCRSEHICWRVMILWRRVVRWRSTMSRGSFPTSSGGRGGGVLRHGPTRLSQARRQSHLSSQSYLPSRPDQFRDTHKPGAPRHIATAGKIRHGLRTHPQRHSIDPHVSSRSLLRLSWPVMLREARPVLADTNSSKPASTLAASPLKNHHRETDGAS
jgi:hypothetical protein